MNTMTLSRNPVARARLAVLLAAFAAAAFGPSPMGAAAADPSAEPAQLVSPAAVESMCESIDTLRLIVGFLRETSVSEDGMVPLLVGAIAGLSEARRLVGLAEDTYRPLTDELTGSFGGLRQALEEFRDQGTIGAGIASVGEAITRIGDAMDALSTTLRSPCAPVPPAASEVPQ